MPSKTTVQRKMQVIAASSKQLIMFLMAVLAGVIAMLEIAVVTTMRFQPVRDEPSTMVREAASQLKTQQGWRMLSEESRTQDGYCPIGNCSYIQQVWDIGVKPMDCPTLQQLLAESNYNVAVKKTYPESCITSIGMLSSEASAANGKLLIKASVFEGTDLSSLSGDQDSGGAKLVLYVGQPSSVS